MTSVYATEGILYYRSPPSKGSDFVALMYTFFALEIGEDKWLGQFEHDLDNRPTFEHLASKQSSVFANILRETGLSASQLDKWYTLLWGNWKVCQVRFREVAGCKRQRLHAGGTMPAAHRRAQQRLASESPDVALSFWTRLGDCCSSHVQILRFQKRLTRIYVSAGLFNIFETAFSLTCSHRVYVDIGIRSRPREYIIHANC